MNKLLPTTYLLIYLVAAVLLRYIFPLEKLIQAPYSYLGIVLIIFGIALNLWADRMLKDRKTTVKPFEKPSALITNGAFRLSRHPIYLGFVSILLGVAMLLESSASLFAPIFMFFTLEFVFIPKEENNLLKEFGGKYKDYQKKVRKWI